MSLPEQTLPVESFFVSDSTLETSIWHVLTTQTEPVTFEELLQLVAKEFSDQLPYPRALTQALLKLADEGKLGISEGKLVLSRLADASESSETL
jgi:hypothetical protein